MSRRRGLGSGLDALIPSQGDQTAEAVRLLAVDAITTNRSQPRTQFDEQALDELTASIREHGLIQPIIVSERPEGGYELIAGERRWRAARRAGLGQVPALVKSATPQQLLELALVENVQRADLNALEEGLAYQTLKDEFSLTDEMIAQRVGKSRVAVVNTRRLIRLTAAAQQALLDGSISAGHGRALLRIERVADQEAALELIVRRDLSVREAERLAEVAQHPQLTPDLRSVLLEGSLGLAQAQALLRIEDGQQQRAACGHALSLGLSARETEQLADLLTEGVAMTGALAQVRGRTGDQPPGAQRTTSSPSSPRGPGREPQPEEVEMQRMFEAVLETPVQLVIHGETTRLTITFYSSDQLQGFYDRLAEGRSG